MASRRADAVPWTATPPVECRKTTRSRPPVPRARRMNLRQSSSPLQHLPIASDAFVVCAGLGFRFSLRRFLTSKSFCRSLPKSRRLGSQSFSRRRHPLPRFFPFFRSFESRNHFERMENHHESNRSRAADRGDRGRQCRGTRQRTGQRLRIRLRDECGELHLRSLPEPVPTGVPGELLRVIAA